MKICDYIYCEGHDVKCRKLNKVLGDIMGYNGSKCNNCKHKTKYKKKK